MPLMEALTLNFAPAIAKSLLKFWLKDTWAEEIPGDIVYLIKDKTADVQAQQKGKRQFEAIGEKIAESLLPLFEAEHVTFSEARKEELVALLTTTLNNARLTVEILAARNLEPIALAKYLLRFQPEAVRDLSEPERDFFNRAVSETSRSIVDIASRLPTFNERTFAEVLKRETQLIAITEEILEEVRRIREQSHQENATVAAAKFEENYLLAVIRRLDELQLFGVDVSKASKRHKLSVAYVTLSVEQRVLPGMPILHSFGDPVMEFDGDEEDEEEHRVVLPVDRVLASARRLLIRGSAGSGKTTLLQWIAVNSAGRKFTHELSEWNDTIPYYIRLREYVDKPLPAPEEFPKLLASTIAAEMPDGWAHEKLRSGRAIVLIDGVDELPETWRDEVRQWVDGLVGNFRECRFIVTSRPSAVEEGWLSDEGFEDAELQAMQLPDIVNFIDHWHAAVREELPEGEEKAELPELSEALKTEIRRSKQKRELATSPLLCAMLCALHRDRKRQLPSDRVQLYEACIEMLIERRDIERRIQLHDYPVLGYRQKRVLLEELAYWMLKNNWPDVEWAQVEDWLDKKLQNMHGLPANATTENVLNLLVERSGIVREPVSDHIDFTHKTLQEFLAAHSIINEGDTGLLIENAHRDQWREVVILASGVTKKEREREDIIRGLLARGDQEAERRYQLHLLAVACLENSISLSPALNAEVKVRLRKLLPPNNLTDAKAVASAGELAVPFLAKYTNNTGNIAAACVRALFLIGDEAAWVTLRQYANDRRQAVINEFKKAWPTFDAKTEEGKRALSLIYGNSTTLDLSNSRQLTDLTGLVHLPRLRALDLSWCFQLRDLSGLAHLPSLMTLRLSGCEELLDQSLLPTLPNLTTLDLSWCDELSDLSGVPQLPSLTMLDLSKCDHLRDLSKLAQLPNLTTLNLSRCSQLIDLSLLPTLTNLTRLNLSRCDQLGDLSKLAQLPNLTTLILSYCYALSDLSVLANLPKLKTLHAWGILEDVVLPEEVINRIKILG
jgi:hypothetical protein